MRELKKEIIGLAAEDLLQFLNIVEDLGVKGLRIYRHKMRGHSLQQCAVKFRVTKRRVQLLVEKCNAKGYGDALKKLNMLK